MNGPGHESALHERDVPVIHDHQIETQVQVAFPFQLVEGAEDLPLVAHVPDGAVADAAHALGVGRRDALAERAFVLLDGVLGDDAEGEIVGLPHEQPARKPVFAEMDFTLSAFGKRGIRADAAKLQRPAVDVGEVPAAVHDEDGMIGAGGVDVRPDEVTHLLDHAVVVAVPDDPLARFLGCGVFADQVLQLGDVLDVIAGELEEFALRPVRNVRVGFDEAGDECPAFKVDALGVVRDLPKNLVAVSGGGDPVPDGVHGLDRVPFGLHGQDRSVVEYLSVHSSLL